MHSKTSRQSGRQIERGSAAHDARRRSGHAATLLALCLALACGSAASRELHSYAIVEDDASLRIEGERVHLYGIHIPDTGRSCRSDISPVRCGSRAALALTFRIQGFVHCYPQAENPDGSLTGICYADRGRFDAGEDLAAYLLQRGLAVARPGGPFEYHALEGIARQGGRGIWGGRVGVPYPAH